MNTKEKGAAEGAQVDQAGGLKSTNYTADFKADDTTLAALLANRSTATEVQLAKVLALLRQGPKTTMELREHSILMPAARVFQLKQEGGYTITTELLPLFDAQGVRHSKCARYHLIEAKACSEVV